MAGSYLLDTNVCIHILNREIDLASRKPEGRAFLSVTVVGEFLYGADKSRRRQENRSRVERLVEICPLIQHDLETARRYGAIKADLARAGRPIPDNDLWIAAVALQHGLTLATRDPHFDYIRNLATEAW